LLPPSRSATRTAHSLRSVRRGFTPWLALATLESQSVRFALAERVLARLLFPAIRYCNYPSTRAKRGSLCDSQDLTLTSPPNETARRAALRRDLPAASSHSLLPIARTS
jgi:hypothetical protein